MPREKFKRIDSARARVPMRDTGAESLVVGDEGSVTELDRRGDVARLYYVGNPQGEDQRG